MRRIIKPTLSQTKELVQMILQDPGLARFRLGKIRIQENEIYWGLITFSDELKLTSTEWFILLSTFRSRVLRDDLRIMAKLSEKQKDQLPLAKF